MSKYESMPSWKLSWKIAERKFDDILNISQATESAVEIIFENGQRTLFDINAWKDMGPIIEKIWDSELFEIVPYTEGMSKWAYKSVDISPLRAAAIIYLEGLEADNG